VRTTVLDGEPLFQENCQPATLEIRVPGMVLSASSTSGSPFLSTSATAIRPWR
jgi:hypothetical protein